MNIENEIFKRMNVDFKKLIEYGFIKENNIYKYSKEFMDSFRADIIIDEEGTISGKIYDTSTNYEYTNFRLENQAGEFVNSVREEYKKILNDISKNCFTKKYFITKQANRVTKMIMDLYHDEPEFAWEKFPGYAIFKNSSNEKWYGLICNIDKNKLDKKTSGEVEILNVKLDSNDIEQLLNKKVFYPAYHMNKKNWISIILDDTLTDEEIIKYIKISHSYTEVLNEWIISANPKFYDVINCFNNTDIIDWKQSSNIKVGDIIYLYVGAPYSAILYKCEVIETNIPYKYKDKNLSMNRVMKIKLLKRYNSDEYTFEKLNEYGIKAIRGPRSITKKLSDEINNYNL